MLRATPFVVLLALLSCGGSQKNTGPASEEEMVADAKAFADGFWSEESVDDYIAKIDSLIDEAQASSATSAAAGIAQTKTNNGILVLFSVTNRAVKTNYHVSFSRRPHFAEHLAKSFAVLVARRLGFPPPGSLMLSQNEVYHLDWNLENSAQVREEIAAVQENLRAEVTREDVITEALAKGIEVELSRETIQSQ